MVFRILKVLTVDIFTVICIALKHCEAWSFYFAGIHTGVLFDFDSYRITSMNLNAIFLLP